MKPHIKEIASRIRFLREDAGISRESLAASLNIPIDKYIAYEAGEIEFPVSIMDDIATYFSIELSTIITGEEPKLKIYCVTRSGKGVTAKRFSDYNYEALAYKMANKNMEPFLVTIPWEEGAEVVFHSHPGKEFEFILEGALEITVNGKTITLREGDSIFLDSSYPHGIRALGGKPCRVLAVIN